MRLDGKNVFVTGGSRGIGKSICTALAKEGANIAFTYLEQTKMANEVVEEIEKLDHDGENSVKMTGPKNITQNFSIFKNGLFSL